MYTSNEVDNLLDMSWGTENEVRYAINVLTLNMQHDQAPFSHFIFRPCNNSNYCYDKAHLEWIVLDKRKKEREVVPQNGIYIQKKT